MVDTARIQRIGERADHVLLPDQFGKTLGAPLPGEDEIGHVAILPRREELCPLRCRPRETRAAKNSVRLEVGTRRGARGTAPRKTLPRLEAGTRRSARGTVTAGFLWNAPQKTLPARTPKCAAPRKETARRQSRGLFETRPKARISDPDVGRMPYSGQRCQVRRGVRVVEGARLESV
ncbi:hypothetical protein GCM10027431_05910 [Lysobacter rhizosphaerae]